MFDINEAFIQALQKQELEENLNYNEVPNATAADDNEKEREYYGKYMTKRDKVRSLDQAKRNLERAETDDRVSFGQTVDKVSFENTQGRDLDIYKARKDYAGIYRGEGPKYNKNLTINGKSKLEPTDAHLETADMWDKDAEEIADKIRTKHGKKEEFLDANVNVSTGDISSNLDLGGLGSLAGLLASEEPKDSEEKLEEDTDKKSLTYQYEENGNYFYKDDNGTVYADMSFQPDSVDLWVCSAEYNEPIKQVNANEFELNGNPKTDKNFERNEKYKGSYMLLSRLESDCKYYLGNGNRNEKVLWAGSVDKQIAKMKELWNSFPDDMKPEWLSMEDIENYEKEMKTEMKTEAEETKGATITQELHTDLLPILNMYQYDIADGVEISREELDEVMQDKAMPIIEETIKTILPTAEVKAGKFYNPPYYRFGSGNNDQLDFTVTVPEADYKKLEADTLAKEDFEEFLKKTYKSYDGFISTMPDSIKEFEEAEDWEQFVAILSYYITPYEHQEEFTADVLDYIWGNFPTEEDEDEYDDETNWAAEEEAEADERFENRYMNGGNGFTADKKDESKEVLKETDADMYKRIKEEPRTEKYEKGLKIRDEIVNAWKSGDLKTAYTKWEELFNMFSSGYDDEGNVTEEWNNEQALRDMMELNMITDTIEDKCVYDVTDYGKEKSYKEMGY